jgi:hypothetical protein
LKNSRAQLFTFKRPAALERVFLVNKEGRVLTAAHVALDRTFTVNGPQPAETIKAKDDLHIIDSNGKDTNITLQTLKERDLANSVFDLALIETGIPSSCHLTIADPTQMKVGNHLIASAFQGPLLREYFMKVF